MQFTITPQDIAYFIIFCVIVAVGIYLFIVLHNFLKLLKQVNKVLDENQESITKTINLLPDTVKNVNETTQSIKDSVDKAASTIGSIEGTVTETLAAVSDNTDSVLSIVTIASKIVNIVLSIFSSRK